MLGFALKSDHQTMELVEACQFSGNFATIAARAGLLGADPLDLLSHLAFNAHMLTRRERADRVEKKRRFLPPYYS